MPRSVIEGSPVRLGAEGLAAESLAGTRRGLGVLLVVGGSVGLVAAVILLVEKITLIADPAYVPTCDISPVLSCGSVMNTPQAEAFGIPNPVLGIAGFAAVAAIGAACLAGAVFARWFWVLVQAGVSFAVVFVHWLIYQSVFVIGALCPYCMIVWIVTIPVFWYVSVANLQPLRTIGTAGIRRALSVLTEYRGAILTAWYLIIAGLIAYRFWDYWITLV